VRDALVIIFRDRWGGNMLVAGAGHNDLADVARIGFTRRASHIVCERCRLCRRSLCHCCTVTLPPWPLCFECNPDGRAGLPPDYSSIELRYLRAMGLQDAPGSPEAHEQEPRDPQERKRRRDSARSRELTRANVTRRPPRRLGGKHHGR
jgi:hypothetical protein